MRIYSVHIRRHSSKLERDFMVIKHGFSWSAFFFSGFWAFWYRHWLFGVAIITVLLAIIIITRFLGGTALIEFVLCAGWFMTVGALANDMRRYYLDQAGFIEVGDTVGKTPEEALYLYLKEASE